MIPTEPGIYRGLPDANYRAIPAVSQSTLKAFSDCPRKWKLSEKKEPTPAMIYGSLVDALWLTGDTSRFAFMPHDLDGRTKEGKAWKSENAGREIVTADMRQRAQAACARLNETPDIKAARDACDVQVAVVAELEGVLCKGLIDLCPRDGVRSGLADLKTAASADPETWGRYVYNTRLHWQAAMYLDLWNRATGEDLQDFFHIVSEQEPPHEPCMMPLSRDFIALGRTEYRRALARFAECREKDEWPGYPSGAVVDVEPWMLRRSD